MKLYNNTKNKDDDNTNTISLYMKCCCMKQIG